VTPFHNLDARLILIAFHPNRIPPSSHHVDIKTISKCAQLEYQYGERERGKTIFEGIVDSHPKRYDLWSVYVDMEAKQRDIGSIRCAGQGTLGWSLLIISLGTYSKEFLTRSSLLRKPSRSSPILETILYTKPHYRFFFKKWLDLEKSMGDEAGEDAVKQKAVEWMQQNQSSS